MNEGKNIKERMAGETDGKVVDPRKLDPPRAGLSGGRWGELWGHPQE